MNLAQMLNGEQLINLVKSGRLSIPPGAIRIHKIEDEDKRRYKHAAPLVAKIEAEKPVKLAGAELVVYRAIKDGIVTAREIISSKNLADDTVRTALRRLCGKGLIKSVRISQARTIRDTARIMYAINKELKV